MNELLFWLGVTAGALVAIVLAATIFARAVEAEMLKRMGVQR